jgi:ABC-type nitrate/sulfonate/bicarbonate transport system permease component
MIRRIGAFGAVWYGFVVGDDWCVASGVGAALAVTSVVSRVSALLTWWIVVAAVGVLLVSSIRRATGRADANDAAQE